jgi:cytochrome c peroxidase
MKRLIVNVVTIIAVLSVSAPFSLTASAAIENAVVQPSTAPAVVGALDPVAVRAAAVAAGMGSLRDVPIPQVNNIGDFLNPGQGAKSMAVVLGKALFWDMQVGSDGMACASCHFSAGADNRTKNQLNPGTNANPPDTTFGNSMVIGAAGFPQFNPNHDVTINDFPFHKLADPLKEDFNHRVILSDTNDVISSQGVFNTTFTGIVPGQLHDAGIAVADPVFNVGGVNVRRVEPRNTPTVINSVFNFDNFWDGRARNQFNGINPFGTLDSTATILVNETGTLQQRQVTIPNSSLASQAVGPPLSNIEMSFAGRKFPDVGKKLLASRPLAFQRVHRDDSVLGSFSRGQGQDGLTFATYAEMVQIVFQSKYWDSNSVITFNADGSRVINPPGTPNGYTQMEANFSLFFGLAVQAYESTLVSDKTRFDRFMEGDDLALTQDELAGLLIFIKGPAQAVDPLFAGISQGSLVSGAIRARYSAMPLSLSLVLQGLLRWNGRLY